MRRSRGWQVVAAGLVVAVVAGVAIVRIRSSEPPCDAAVSQPQWSVARRWNEALLRAVARDLPAPTVHARNLFHLSAAMWDAWAAYEPGASGYFVDEAHRAGDVAAAREEAISYAAHRVLEARYLDSIGAVDSIPEFDALMAEQCFPIELTDTAGASPAALGNRIAEAVLAAGMTDGSNQAEGYDAPDYTPVNAALVVPGGRTGVADPNRWQPLQLDYMLSQNGIWIEEGVQEFVGPHWGHVAGFAVADAPAPGVPLDPGDPPYLGDPGSDAAFKDGVVEVLRFSSLLDPTGGASVDVSPRASGANALGRDDGTGHPVNPVTGEPYAPNVVGQADYVRALAEYWADGPRSETPPGHWNTIANEVSDALEPDLMIGGDGPVVDRLEWDVKLFLALNGANHDAAVVAWGTKGHYDYARPISMIWYMASRGQSSDPDAGSYHPEGLPLIDGLIELVTEDSTAAGERHAALASHQGEIAVRTWAGNPNDPESETGGVTWILASSWVPYQQPTFVTPSFAGYVSGHSTFSRAAAEVLGAFTGSEFFPGGLREWTIPAGSFEVEAGPQDDITLQAATYVDAADQAGISRRYGGIHVLADDHAGRRMGADVGVAAWDLARDHFGVTAGGTDTG